MSETNSQTAQHQQVQRGNQGEGIKMQCWRLPRLRSVICWWRDGCLIVVKGRPHMLTSWTRELASDNGQLTRFLRGETVFVR